MEEITVIVPVYNMERKLEKCLDSLAHQSFPKGEILMIDDGSSDRSPQICRQYEKKYKNFHYFYKENGGVSSARNYGISAARGKWLAFVDSDDYVEPDFLEKMAEQAGRYQAQMVCCGYFYEKGDFKTPVSSSCQGLITHENFWKSILRGEEIGGFMCNKMIKADLFQGIQFPEGKIFEDKIILPKLVGRCQRIAVIGEPLYHYIFQSSSLTNHFSREKAENLIEARETVYRYVRENFPTLEQECRISRMREAIILFNALTKAKIWRGDPLLEAERAYICSHWKDSRQMEKKLRISAWMIRWIPGLYEKLQYGRNQVSSFWDKKGKGNK